MGERYKGERRGPLLCAPRATSALVSQPRSQSQQPNMRLTIGLATLCLSVAPSLAVQVRRHPAHDIGPPSSSPQVSYDPVYDNANASLATVACSE